MHAVDVMELSNRNTMHLRSNRKSDLHCCHLGLGLVVLLVTMLLGGCTPESREIGRYASPDKLVDAVLVEVETSALDATPTKLFLVPSGKDWRDHSPILTGDYFEELKIVWSRARFLEIHYKKGRIFSFASFWSSKNVEAFRHIVELRLFPEGDSALPDRNGE